MCFVRDDEEADSVIDLVQGCSLADAEGEWVVCRVFRRSQQQPRRRAGDGTAPHRTMPAPPSLSSASSASCVTDGSDQEEVSS